MGRAGVVVAGVVRHAVGVSVSSVAWDVATLDHGEGLCDVAPAVGPLDRVGQVDVGGGGVHGLPRLGGHHGVRDDDLLAGDQGVVGGRVQIEVGPASSWTHVALWRHLWSLAIVRIVGGIASMERTCLS